MSQSVHIGYHNCLHRGTIEEIREGVPFLSGPGDNQWLSQGYYLWTDSPKYALTWNSGAPTVVSEFEITFESRDELLDLVGNAKDIIEFEAMIGDVVKSLNARDATQITVNQVISYFRELQESAEFKGVFPYDAVKAQDKARSAGGEVVLKFVRQRKETLIALTRQQMCVFEKARAKIRFKCFIAPQEFTQAL